MAFTTDEAIYNSINLDSITDYKLFLEQLKPILLSDSGFTEADDPAFAKGLAPLEAALSNKKTRLGMQQQVLQQLAPKVAAGTLTDAEKKQFEAAKKEADDLSRAGVGGIARAQADIDKYKANTPQKALQKTAERLAAEASFKKLQESQLALTSAQLDRQQKALKGEIPTSPILEKQIQDEFNTFKESQARAGNIIVGDNPFTAVGKGTSAENSLARFQDNAKAAKQREIQAIIQGETPLAYQGLGLASGYGAPQAPAYPDIGGVSQLSLAAQQPFQFAHNMAYNYANMNQGSKRSSGKSGLLGSLGGAGLGIGLAALAPGTLGLSSALSAATLGSQFGGGFGTLFGGGY